MKIGDFLNTLATSAGIPSDDPALKQLLSSPSLVESDIPDSVANGIKSGLLTVEAAKNHPDIQAHHKALNLNGVDARVKDIMSTYKDVFTQSEIDRIESIKSSYDKINEIIKVTNTYHENNKPEPKDGEVKTLREQVQKLNSDILSLRDEKQKLVASHESELSATKNDFLATNTISGFDFGSALSKNDYVNLTKTKIDGWMQSNGLVAVNENGELVVKRKGEDGSLSDYFVNNERVLYKDQAQKIAADNKYIGVSNPNPTPQPTPTPQNGVNTSKYQAAVESAAKDLNG